MENITKKQFTEKEIVMFFDFIKNGILETDAVLDNNNIIDEISENLCMYSPENIIDKLDFNKLANWIDKVYINDNFFENEIVPFAKNLNKLIKNRLFLSPVERLELLIDVDRQSLSALLGLRDWATKEDIMNEINNIL